VKKLIILAALLIFPVNFSFAAVSVVGELSREKTASPGDKFEGVIFLRNNEEETFQAKVYKTDYLFSADGTNKYAEPGSTSRSNAGWISLKPAQLSIPAHDTGAVYYSVEVPKDPGLSGSYWSMLMVESIPAKSLESLKKNSPKNNALFQTAFRYGVQIVTEITGTGKSGIKFGEKKLISQGGRKFLQFDVENTGEKWLRPSVWLELYNKEGKSIGRFEGRRMRIYPGCSVRQEIDLEGIPKGDYKGLLVVDNGGQDVFGAEYSLGIK